MRIFGLAFVLLGAFLSFSDAQTPPPDPGDYLLRTAKAVADSGQVDNPAAVSDLLHMTLTRSGHGVMGPGPESCPAGGHRVDNNYAVVGNDWFHPLPTGKQHMLIQYRSRHPNGKQTEVALGNPQIDYGTLGLLGCATPSQNSIIGYIDFNNIPAYACISEAQIKAIFPNTLPLPPVTSGGWGDDFDYLNADAQVSFQMTLQPGVTDPHHQPVCLMHMHIDGRYILSASQKLNFLN
jgi:hypothetical protein